MDVDSDYGSDLDGFPSTQTAKSKGKGQRRRGGLSDNGYAWEGEFQRTWDAVQEDAAGSLQSAATELGRKRRRLQTAFGDDAIQRGIIRHIFLLLDLSTAMLDRDLRPSRLDLMLSYSQDFVTEFFDANPISQLGIIGLRDGLAVRVTPLSGNPSEHIKALQNKRKLEPSGEPSLQNGLEMASAGLAHLPSHGSREILGVFGSLTTCDPGNIHHTLDRCVKQGLRISIVGLSAEMAVCKLMAKRTDGALNKLHLEHTTECNHFVTSQVHTVWPLQSFTFATCCSMPFNRQPHPPTLLHCCKKPNQPVRLFRWDFPPWR